MTENNNNKIGNFLSKYAKALVLLALVVVISIPMVEMMYLLGIKGLFNYFSNKVTTTTGVNQYLANAIIMALMIPLLWSLKWTFSFSSQKRRTGYSIVAGYILVFYLSMFFLTKEQKFDFSTGKATKYYANTPEGMRYFDAPGFDPKYGIPLKPVDPNVARSEALHTRPPQKLEDPKQFFDFVTRESMVWYYEGANGAIEFYDQPGFHPKYAIELKPVTPEIVKKHEAKLAAIEATKKAEEERRRLLSLEEKKKQEEEERRRKDEYVRSEVEKKAKEEATRRLEEEKQRVEIERRREASAKQISNVRGKENDFMTRISVKNSSSIPIQIRSGEFAGIKLAPGEISETRQIRNGIYGLRVAWSDLRGRIHESEISREITPTSTFIEVRDKQ